MNNKGLTLIEVLISITLLALISIAIYQATTRSFEVNEKLGAESTELTEIIVSLQVLENDLSQLYSPQLPADDNPLESTQNPSTYWSAPIRADGLRRTRFSGTREKISFINNGNRRLERGLTQSDLQKVLYEIEQNKDGSFSLFRTIDWDVFNYEDQKLSSKKIPRVSLISNIRSAKFSFYRKSSKAWDDTWDSEGSFAKAEERFPEIISLKIEVPDPTNNANNQVWEMQVRPLLSTNAKAAKSEIVDPSGSGGAGP